ncbi:MAG TPA: FAD-dependent oxidoreductase, partial [Phycisphaeraceae bacterium]
GWRSNLRKFDRVTPDKTDTNNYGAVSTDYIGHSDAWPEADYATRERIFQEHVTYQQGLMWFQVHDPAVPDDVREQMAQWGLCRDEFQATGGWPHQIYVREGRRMVSDYVITEHDCRGDAKAEDSVGLASYTMDSHNCQRFVRDGRVLNEGDVQVPSKSPYPVPYRSIVPSAGQCENLLVPVCLSASHIAFGSVRMEPVFMILSQSAATAAALAIDAGVAVQQVDYPTLRKQLESQRQLLEYVKPEPAAKW